MSHVGPVAADDAGKGGGAVLRSSKEKGKTEADVETDEEEKEPDEVSDSIEILLSTSLSSFSSTLLCLVEACEDVRGGSGG